MKKKEFNKESEMANVIAALDELEAEKGINKALIIADIEKAIASACEGYFGKDTVKVNLDPETGELSVRAPKQVVDKILDVNTDILLEDAKHIDPDVELGDLLECDVNTLDFGRIAAQKARGIILQGLKENERKAMFDHFKSLEGTIVKGKVVSINNDKNKKNNESISVNLEDKLDVILKKREMIPGEKYAVGNDINVLILSVEDNKEKKDKKKDKKDKKDKKEKSGFHVIITRSQPEFVIRLFEQEVEEMSDGTVEVMSISREAGSRSKLAVWSNDEDVDAVGACVGVNSTRINRVVAELGDEKIDVIEWNEDDAIFIENALRPAPVVSVTVDTEERTARVIVPDDKLSLAIGREGQNARLAARLTDYKIDIKSESQAAAEEDEYDEYDDDELTDEMVDAAVDEYEADVENSNDDVTEDTESEDTTSDDTSDEESGDEE